MLKQTQNKKGIFLWAGLFLLYFVGFGAALFFFPRQLKSVSCVLFGLSGVVFLLFARVLRQDRLFRSTAKDSFLTALYSVTPQMEIILNFLLSFENFQRMEKDAELGEKYELIKDNIAKVRSYILKIHDYRIEVKETKKMTRGRMMELESELKKINSNLYSLSIQLINPIEGFKSVYKRDKKIIQTSYNDMSKILYYLQNIFPILNDISLMSNEASRENSYQVIERFDAISKFSAKVNDEVKQTIDSLTDRSKTDNLAYVSREITSIMGQFEVYLENVKELKGLSQNFVDKSVQELEGISKIAQSIEKIARTVQIMSLNLGIEAANVGEQGGGLQVLARNLRGFAVETMNFAADVKKMVGKTIVSTRGLKDKYVDKMDAVTGSIDEIGGHLKKFNEVVGASFGKLENIFNAIKEFTSKISGDTRKVLGSLQYYDVLKQEVEHSAQIGEQVFGKFYAQKENFFESLGEVEQRDIKKDILETIGRIITTGNERKVLNKYENEFKIKVTEDALIENKAPAELGDDETILF